MLQVRFIVIVGIDHCVELANQANRELVGLVITSPDNPTGNTLTQDDIRTLIEHAVACGISYVMVDLMYHVVTDSGLKLYDIDGGRDNLLDSDDYLGSIKITGSGKGSGLFTEDGAKYELTWR